MKSRRFQLVIPNEAFAVLQRLQGVYGGSLSSVVRRAVEALAGVEDAWRKGDAIYAIPPELQVAVEEPVSQEETP